MLVPMVQLRECPGFVDPDAFHEFCVRESLHDFLLFVRRWSF
jgi:hypothetical protein